MKLQKPVTFVTTIIIVLFLSCGFIKAQQTNVSSSTEDIRLKRLAGLAKVWGSVKFFHPYLAYREIDWDKALIETIPRVNAAKNPEEYQAAINSMLAALGDKNTRARITGKKPKADNQNSPVETEEPILIENGVLMIDASAVAKAVMGANNRMGEFLTKINQNIPAAKAVLIDLRSGDAPSEDVSYFLDYYLRIVLSSILDKNVTLASRRYRMHNGYAPQTGATSGGYYSAMITSAPDTLAGNNKTKTPQIIFLVDENAPAVELLSGLQAAKLAFIIEDGEAAEEAGVSSSEIKLPDNIEVLMRTAELVGADGRIGFAANLTVPKTQGKTAALQLLAENKFNSVVANSVPTFAPQISQKDKTYPEMEFPSDEYRLLALFRFWNVINYFFPYKHLIDKSWDDVLPRYIAKFEANKNAADYQTTVQEMVAEIQDAHGTARFPPSKTNEIPARFYLPIAVKFVENQTMVSFVFDEAAGVKVGDVITAIDGEPMKKYREKLAPLIAASTPQSLQRNLHYGLLLRGAKDSKARLTLRDVSGKIREVELTRTVAGSDPRWTKADQPEKSLPVFGVLPSGFGYVDLARLTVAEVDKMFETIKSAPATIFDMRGYPNGTAWAIAPRLTAKKAPVAALFSHPILEATSLSSSDYSGGTNFTFAQKLPEVEGETYKGKVVMLIDENAQSQSEHTCLFFEAATDVTFIGTPTAGANGDVTNMVLPGNSVVGFSGNDVRHADGRQLQRVGIQPNIQVAPTIRGFVGGRDEILEAAIKFLRAGVKR